MMMLTRAKPFYEQGRRLWVRFRLNEAAPLLSLAAVSFFAWAFLEIAGEVLEGDITTFDRTLLLALRETGNPADPIGPGWLEEAARDITALGGHVVLSLITLATAAYLIMTRRRRGGPPLRPL